MSRYLPAQPSENPAYVLIPAFQIIRRQTTPSVPGKNTGNLLVLQIGLFFFTSIQMDKERRMRRDYRNIPPQSSEILNKIPCSHRSRSTERRKNPGKEQ